MTSAPGEKTGSGMAVVNVDSAQLEFANTVTQGLEELSLTSTTLVQQSTCIVKASSTIQEHLAKSLITMASIANDVKLLLRTLGSLSQELLAKLAANGYASPPRSWALHHQCSHQIGV